MNSENPKLYFLIPLTISVGVMLSPESLVILGNGMGSAGAWFLAFLMLAMVAHFLNVLSYGELFALHPGRADEAFLLKEVFGFFPAVVLPLSSKVMFVICASTGILATAGYVFNEVFVYWFPNLGFSFCLLGLVLAINLLGRKVATTAQVIFVSVALLGIVFLLLVGFLGLGDTPIVAKTVSPLSLGLTRVAFLGLFLFIGHELAALAMGDQEDQRRSLALHLIYALGFIGVVFAAWGLVSLKYVTIQRLADTSIPHMIVARAIFGQNGRIVMGIVVMAGTLSAVNGLLFAVSRILGNMARERLLPSFFAGKVERPAVGITLLAVGIAAMMGLGMAGEPILEVYIRAALLFWLLSYAAVHLAAFVLKRGGQGQPSKSAHAQVVAVIGFIAMISGFGALVWTDPESIEVVKLMFTVFAVLSIFSVAWIGFNRGKKSSALMKI